jgi:hypothetical protein
VAVAAGGGVRSTTTMVTTMTIHQCGRLIIQPKRQGVVHLDDSESNDRTGWQDGRVSSAKGVHLAESSFERQNRKVHKTCAGDREVPDTKLRRVLGFRPILNWFQPTPFLLAMILPLPILSHQQRKQFANCVGCRRSWKVGVLSLPHECRGRGLLGSTMSHF